MTAAAALLSREAEVTIFTTSLLRQRYEELRAAGDERIPAQVRMVFVPAPTAEEAAGWYQPMHCYSALALQSLREAYGDRGPEVIEFADFLGEGFATVQAAWALDPFLADTRVCVRMHTTAEMVEVLDGFWKPDLGSRAVHAMERFCLARADRVIWQGGDILDAYRRFYGTDAIAPDVRVRYPYAGPDVPAQRNPSGEGPVRLLYAGRFERRKGVVNLVRAVTGLDRDDFRLTLVGTDTDTGPLGTSLRDQLKLAAGADERVRVRDGVAREQLAELISAHDVVVVPSLWECWPYAALEPLHLNRPVLATPVGGLVEMVVPGRSGWLAAGTGPAALAGAVEDLARTPEQVGSLIQAGGPAARARELCDEREILDGYRRLAGAEMARPRPSSNPDGRSPASRSGLRRPTRVQRSEEEDGALVSVVIGCAAAGDPAPETVDALLAQSHRPLEIVVVGACPAARARALAQLAGRLPLDMLAVTSPSPGNALNLGVRASRGRHLLVLSAAAAPEPSFVARCVLILERRPEVAYVTSWTSRVHSQGGARREPVDQPLGNQTGLVSEENVAGGAAAMIPRWVFDQGFSYSEELAAYADWQMYRELHEAGHHGAVIPERLVRGFPQPASGESTLDQSRRHRLEGEMHARIRENAVRWTSTTDWDH